MRDRQDDDEAGLQRRIAGGDETGRAVLTLVAADRGLPQPQVIVSDNKAGLRVRHRHGRRSLHQLVERRMLTVHLGAFDSLDHDRRRVSGPMGPSGGCHEPVIMIGRHQHELPAAVPGDLDGLAQRLVLELAEFPLELHCGRLRHYRLEGGRAGTSRIYVLSAVMPRCRHRKWSTEAALGAEVNLGVRTEHRVTYDRNPPARGGPRRRCGGLLAAEDFQGCPVNRNRLQGYDPCATRKYPRGRAWPGHPRLRCGDCRCLKTWVPGTSPGKGLLEAKFGAKCWPKLPLSFPRTACG